MLDEMHIANVALIRDTLFQPSSGMTVITGETGSGKTALLNALKLLVGERANAGMIREGAAELAVEGRFSLRALRLMSKKCPLNRVDLLNRGYQLSPADLPNKRCAYPPRMAPWFVVGWGSTVVRG